MIDNDDLNIYSYINIEQRYCIINISENALNAFEEYIINYIKNFNSVIYV